jgi:hypothetical protein
MKLAGWLRAAPIALYLIASVALVDAWCGTGVCGGVITGRLVLAYCIGGVAAAIAGVDTVIGSSTIRPTLLLLSSAVMSLPMWFFVTFPASFRALIPGAYAMRTHEEPTLDPATVFAFVAILAAVAASATVRRPPFRQNRPESAPRL